MSDFRDAQSAALAATHLSADCYAEAVTYWDGSAERSIVAHCRYAIEPRSDQDDGNESEVERLRITCAVDDLPNGPPAYGHWIKRAGDDRAFLFAGTGRGNALVHKATFEREILLQQGRP